jgi:hypothetical protein
MNYYKELYSSLDESTGPLLDYNTSQIFPNLNTIPSQIITPTIIHRPNNYVNHPIINLPKINNVFESNNTTSIKSNSHSNKFINVLVQLFIIGLGIFGCVYIIKS